MLNGKAKRQKKTATGPGIPPANLDLEMVLVDRVVRRPVEHKSAGDFGPSGGLLCVKAILDFAFALVLLVAAAPLLLLAVIVIRLTSHGPAFFQQVRVGYRGRPFTVFKLRTMQHDCERRSGPCWSVPDDPRVTRVGRFLRRTHIDELPQLWNVLRGEMGLIGPRPERPEFVRVLENVLPLYRLRLEVRPGLSGLAQVQLPPDTDLGSVRRKLACDLYYVRNVGVWLDARILVGTVLHVVGTPAGLIHTLLRLPGEAHIGHAYANLEPGRELTAGYQTI